MYVFAEYEHSFDTAVVEHARVRISESERFEPNHVNDFDRMKTYYVRSCRRGSGHSRTCAYEGAKIIHMTVTLEEMAMFKANRPRMADVGRNFVEETHSPQPPLCKDRDHIREEERQQQIDDALNNYKLQCLPVGASTDLEQRLLAMEKELKRLRQGGNSERPAAALCNGSQTAYADLEKKYERVQTDLANLRSDHVQLKKRFRDGNRSILEADGENLESNNSGYYVVRHRTPSPQRNEAASEAEGSVHSNAASDGDEGKKEDSMLSTAASDAEPELAEPESAEPESAEPESAEPGNDQEMNGSSDSEKNSRYSGSRHIGSFGANGMVYAGNNYWIDRREWSKLFSAPTDARFCKLAALLFWTPEELLERSVTGTPSNRSLSSGKFYPRQPLSPEKLATVKGLFRYYAGKDPLAQERQKAVRRHLSATLCNIRRHGVTDLPHSLATRTDEGRP